MSSIEIGSHVPPDDPVKEAEARGADLAQIMLGDPQRWGEPEVLYPGGAAALQEAAAEAGVKLVVHAAYLINLASANNRLRIPSRQLLQKTLTAAAGIGALGVVVHGGHAGSDDELEAAYDNWFKAVDRLELAVPLLIENTAGGSFALARTLEGWRRLWAAISAGAGAAQVGVCLDTCHAYAAGLDLATVVVDLKAITGRIDLVHANDSRDTAGSGADRHANLGHGQADPDAIVAVVRQAGAPVVVETPGGAVEQAADIEWLRERLR